MYLMDDTSLNLCFWENSSYCITKSGQTIDRHNHDIFNSTVLYFVQNTKPVLCTFITTDPYTQYFFTPVQSNSNGNVDCFFTVWLSCLTWKCTASMTTMAYFFSSGRFCHSFAMGRILSVM